MKYLNILIVMFTSVSFAQDSRLFENQWYLTNLVVNGNENIPPFNDMGITFYQLDSGVVISDACNSLFGISTFPSNNTSDFSFTAYGQTLLECMDRIGYEQLYFGFFSESNTQTNSFNYAISESGNVKTLIINSMLNKQAIYSTQMLSTSQYRKFDFSITPNPVGDYINIKFDQQTSVNAKIEIYNSVGRLCKTIETNGNQERINIENLLSGIYIVTVKNERETTTKKFIKI